MRRVCSSKASPNSVSTRRRPFRKNSSSPYSSSNRKICADTVGWRNPNCFAAAVMEPARAVASNAFKATSRDDAGIDGIYTCVGFSVENGHKQDIFVNYTVGQDGSGHADPATHKRMHVYAFSYAPFMLV